MITLRSQDARAAYDELRDGEGPGPPGPDSHLAKREQPGTAHRRTR